VRSVAPSSTVLPKLGILAGGGSLPKQLIDVCEKLRRPFFVVAIENNADPEVVVSVPHCWARLEAVGRIIANLKRARVKEVVMVGLVTRPSWRDVKPDWRGLKMLPKVLGGSQGDGAILSLAIKELELEGFCVIGIDDVLTDLRTPLGPLGQYHPDSIAQRDIERAIEVGLALGAVDVGQAVVVQHGVVLGVEAVEGTDALLERCLGLCRGGDGGVLLKLKKAYQDSRVDLPTVGPDTVAKASQAGIRGIAIEADASLLVERARLVRDADLAGMFVTGVKVERCLG